MKRRASNKPLENPEDFICITLCGTRSQVITEHALRDVSKPIGVARYVIQLIESLPHSLKGALPSPEQIAAELTAGEE